jgi:hypothetical protein
MNLAFEGLIVYCCIHCPNGGLVIFILCRTLQFLILSFIKWHSYSETFRQNVDVEWTEWTIPCCRQLTRMIAVHPNPSPFLTIGGTVEGYRMASRQVWQLWVPNKPIQTNQEFSYELGGWSVYTTGKGGSCSTTVCWGVAWFSLVSVAMMYSSNLDVKHYIDSRNDTRTRLLDLFLCD